ncbi:hypothetical protein Mapa_000830 [Marchantia paleacea]|nr:hypothetical protein Mapa_000830 [Marchantia paleacea]
MAVSCCTAGAVPSVSRAFSNGKASLSVPRTARALCIGARARAAAVASGFDVLSVKTVLRSVKVRAERDPFAEFSAGFVEDAEEDESVGMTDEERDAIIAFETGGVGYAVEDEAQDSTEDLWEEPSNGPKVYPPRVKKGKGEKIADMLTVFMSLLERPFGGDGRMIAAAGGAVTERVGEEVEALRGVDGVDEQYLFEILRVVKLIDMDLQLVAAARKDTTLLERLMQTAMHTKQALDVANSL